MDNIKRKERQVAEMAAGIVDAMRKMRKLTGARHHAQKGYLQSEDNHGKTGLR